MIGILADTHDNVRAIDYWVRQFELDRADALVHAGDLISPFTIPRLAAFDGTVHAVFGNNDGDRSTLLEKAEEHGVELVKPPASIQAGKLNLMVTHKPGDLPDQPPSDVDLLIHGHTHQPRWEPHKPVINPGEAGGWVTGVSHGALVHEDPLEVDQRAVPAP